MGIELAFELVASAISQEKARVATEVIFLPHD